MVCDEIDHFDSIGSLWLVSTLARRWAIGYCMSAQGGTTSTSGARGPEESLLGARQDRAVRRVGAGPAHS